MKFNIVQYVSQEFSKFSPFVEELNDKIKSQVVDIDYGEDLRSLIIGITMFTKSTAAFYKKRRPKYDKSKRIEKHDDLVLEIERSLSYEIWLSDEVLTLCKSKQEFQTYLASEIVKSLGILDEIKALKIVRKDCLKSDIEVSLRDNGYL